jgi:hypothetical protein
MMKKILSIVLLMVPCVVSAMNVSTKTKIKCILEMPEGLQQKTSALYWFNGGFEVRIGRGKKNTFPVTCWDPKIYAACADKNAVISLLRNQRVIIGQEKSGQLALRKVQDKVVKKKRPMLEAKVK